MRISLVLILSYLSTIVSAGGYQGCLERVWLFQAYDIDELNAEADRKIGFRCRRWIDATHTCQDNNYEACRGTRPNNRCTFDELNFFLGRAPQRNGWSAIDPATGRLDARQSAVNCFNIFNNLGRAVPNFPANRAMKGNVWEYNDYIRKLGGHVNYAYRNKKTDVNKHLWEDFDSTLTRINQARAGDHGQHLITAARRDLGGGIEVHTQDLGNNPATGAKWETVDWPATARNAMPLDPSVDRRSYIRTFLDSFYRGNQLDRDHVLARQHFQVFRSYKRVTDRTVTCRRR